jgi:hypothetical protein
MTARIYELVGYALQYIFLPPIPREEEITISKLRYGGKYKSVTGHIIKNEYIDIM